MCGEPDSAFKRQKSVQKLSDIPDPVAGVSEADFKIIELLVPRKTANISTAPENLFSVLVIYLEKNSSITDPQITSVCLQAYV